MKDSVASAEQNKVHACSQTCTGYNQGIDLSIDTVTVELNIHRWMGAIEWGTRGC